MRTSIGLFLILFLVFFLLIGGPLASPLSADSTVKGYRVIHASPQEFNLALSTKLAKAPKARAEHYASRLEKFFRIQSKVVEGNRVTMEIIPDVPLLEPVFGGSRTVTVVTKLKNQSATSFYYDVEITAGFTILATLEVSPHPSGSLMTCAIAKAPMMIPESLIFKSLFAIGFLADKPAGAASLQ